MTIELPKQARERAVASIERYMRENFDDSVGNLQAAALLQFFLREIAPSVYNQAVAEVQQRLMVRVGELDIECHADEFGHWTAAARGRPR